jgi:hypothetical protein
MATDNPYDYPMNTTDPPAHSAAPASTSVPAAFAAQVKAWYQQFLHRVPSDAEIQSHYKNPSGLDGVYGAIANSKEANDVAKADASKPATTTPPATGGDAGATWDALAAKYGIKDGGAGSGFADRAYWVAHPSEITNGRFASDLAGTGPDQPGGTPGTGPWQNSGASDRQKWGGATPPSTTGAPANYVKGQRYTIDQVPGATQYAPNPKGNIYSDGKGNYFQADSTGGATYQGTDPSAFTTPAAGAPSLADLAKLANGGGNTSATGPVASLGLQMANNPLTTLGNPSAPKSMGAPSLMDLATLAGKGGAAQWQ